MPASGNQNLSSTENAQQRLAFLKQAIAAICDLEEKATHHGMRSVSTCLYLADLLLQQEYESIMRNSSGGKNV